MGMVRDMLDTGHYGFSIRPFEDYLPHIIGLVLVSEHLGLTMPDGYTGVRFPESPNYVVVMTQPKTPTELPRVIGTGYVDIQKRKACIQSIFEG